MKKGLINVTSRKTRVPVRTEISKLKPCVHGGLIRKTAQQYDFNESDLLDFSASLNPLGTPLQYYDWGLENIISNNMDKLTQYPDNRYPEFREAAARFIGGVDKDNIIPGNGSCELIRLVAECVVEKDDRVIIPQPTFDEYELQCRIFGASPIYISHDELSNVSDELLKSSKIIFVCNPNNPTGKLVPQSTLRDLAGRCARNNTLLFVDEAFIELSDPEQSIAELVHDNDYVFILRSLTKSFAIPGIRIGFGVASKQLAKALNNARLSWNLGFIPDVVGTQLLNMDGGVNSQYFIDSRKMIDRERKHLIDRISRIHGFTPINSSVNYILVDLSKSMMDSAELTRRLAARGILVRDCSSFYSLDNDFIRIAVRTWQETDRLAKNIGKAMTDTSRDRAKEKLEHRLNSVKGKSLVGSNTACPYYPCHYEGQDCTFCFCPFYPCEDERTGGKCIERSTGGKVWSCMNCYIVHDPEVAQEILDILKENGNMDKKIKKAWDEVIEPLLSEG